MKTGSKTAKRALDLVVSVLGTIVMSPLLLVIAALIKLDSRGRVALRKVAGCGGMTLESIPD